MSDIRALLNNNDVSNNPKALSAFGIPPWLAIGLVPLSKEEGFGFNEEDVCEGDCSQTDNITCLACETRKLRKEIQSLRDQLEDKKKLEDEVARLRVELREAKKAQLETAKKEVAEKLDVVPPLPLPMSGKSINRARTASAESKSPASPKGSSRASGVPKVSEENKILKTMIEDERATFDSMTYLQLLATTYHEKMFTGGNFDLWTKEGKCEGKVTLRVVGGIQIEREREGVTTISLHDFKVHQNDFMGKNMVGFLKYILFCARLNCLC